MPHGLVVLEGIAEAGRRAVRRLRAAIEVPAGEDAAQEVPVLHQDRVIQPKLLGDCLQRRGTGAAAGEQHRGVGTQCLRHHEKDQEGHQADDPEDDDEPQQSPDDEASHLSAFLSRLSPWGPAPGADPHGSLGRFRRSRTRQPQQRLPYGLTPIDTKSKAPLYALVTYTLVARDEWAR